MTKAFKRWFLPIEPLTQGSYIDQQAARSCEIDLGYLKKNPEGLSNKQHYVSDWLSPIMRLTNLVCPGFGLIDTAVAVHLFACYDPWCRGQADVQTYSLEPNQCYTIVEGNLETPLSTAQVSGLQDTNADGGDYVELYTEGGCEKWKSRIKWSGFCLTIEHRSVKYIPPSFVNLTMELEVSLSEEEVLAAAQQKRADEELEARMLELERKFLREHPGSA